MNNESSLSRDVTNSSVSMSEGEGEGDLENIAKRVAELEEVLHGKEADVEALHTQIDQLRAETASPSSSHSHNSSINYKELIITYQNKLQEFNNGINQRDTLIEELTSSLQQALASRDALLKDDILHTDTNKGDTAEKIAPSSQPAITQLESKLEKANEYINILELENKNHSTLLLDYKQQIEYLNKQICDLCPNIDNVSCKTDDMLEVKKQYEAKIEKIKKDMKCIVAKFTEEINITSLKHEQQIKNLIANHNNELLKLMQENKELEARYLKQLKTFQCREADFKNAIDKLHQELNVKNETYLKEKIMLSGQVELHQIQLDKMSAEYTQSLNNLKLENEDLKFKLNDLSYRYNASQQLIDNNQAHERTLSNKIFTLEKKLSRLSGISFSELDATSYQSFDEFVLQNQLAQQKENERADLEQKLTQKIQDLEDTIQKLKGQLEEANLAKEGYEKQIKDMKNLCDRLRLEINLGDSNIQEEQQNIESFEPSRMFSIQFEQEINHLKNALEKRENENAEYVKKLEELSSLNDQLKDESEKLKHGLTSAWTHCSEIDKKLNCTLRLESSVNSEDVNSIDKNKSINFSFDLEHMLPKQSFYENLLKKLDFLKQQVDSYEKEKSQLIQSIDNGQKEKQHLQKLLEKKEKEHCEEMNRIRCLLTSYENGNIGLQQQRKELEDKHFKEMEDLKTYFEEKWLKVAKEYSEEIFSQNSKKTSDDSETDEFTDDLFVGNCIDGLGGGGDSLNTSCNGSKELKNDISKLNSEFDDKIANITAEYEEKLRILQKQMFEAREKVGHTTLLKAVNQFCQTEKNLSTENCNDSHELSANYNRQLEEQIGLARIEILNALQEQIQALITSKTDSEENWPSELLELRDKFASHFKQEIEILKQKHCVEIENLIKEKQQVASDLKKEIMQLKSQTQESVESDVQKERDLLHRTCVALKTLIEELILYFKECEEEVNNTILYEIVKSQYASSDLKTDEIMHSGKFYSDCNKIKKVRFAPSPSEIASIVSSSSDINALISSDIDLVALLKTELDSCRKMLKIDSDKILGNNGKEVQAWLNCFVPVNQNDKLGEAHKLIKTLREESDHLKVKVIEMQERLLVTENKNELINEGYGEQNGSTCDDARQNLNQLQDRAKYVVTNGSDDTVYLLQLIEELCKQADKFFEDMKKEKEDLQQQIEAADNQLKLTRKFQEEQAIERESERDEAAKKIQYLQECLKEREKEKDRDYRITANEQCWLYPAPSYESKSTLQSVEIGVTVESLLAQLKEVEAKQFLTENELKNAIDKIWDLREVITELEQQVQSKNEKEELLHGQINKLEEIVYAQTKNQQELVQELENFKSSDDNNDLTEHIDNLQEELRKHQMNSEQLSSSSAFKQIKTELKDLQFQIDKKTKELEALHVCGSSLSLSQPSEDVSIRDQIDAARCPTPEDFSFPSILPLDYILKIKELLIKHFRVEDVALKRLKDVDIQLVSIQRQNEDLQAEQDLLQQKISEQLFENEKLKAGLEQQKQNAPFVQRQAVSKVESQLYETNDKLRIAERALIDKNLELNDLKDQLNRANRMLSQKENEIASVFQSENKVIQKLRDQLEVIEEDKQIMKTKLESQERSCKNLPHLIDTMIADKNEEIDHLKEQLIKKEKQLEIYLSLNLDDCQLQELLRQSDQKNSARTLSDIGSINSECEETVEAIREAANNIKSQNISNFRIPNLTITNCKKLDSLQVPTLDLGSLSSRNSVDGQIDNLCDEKSKDTSDLKTGMVISENENFICPRHRNDALKDDSSSSETLLRIQELEVHLCEIREELLLKNGALEQREKELKELKNNFNTLQEAMDFLSKDNQHYKEQVESSHNSEAKIKLDLEKVENKLKLQSEEIENYREKIERNEIILSKETERTKSLESSLNEKIREIQNFEKIIQEKNLTIESLKIRTTEIETEIKQLYEFKMKFESSNSELSKCLIEIERLSEAVNTRDQLIQKLEDLARRNSINTIVCDKDEEMVYLQENLREKDEIILKASDDSRSLVKALETIQNKLKESAYVDDLKKKLKEERILNKELQNKINQLSASFEFDISTPLDQQILNTIDSNEVQELIKIKKDNDLLKSRLLDYENKISHLNSDLKLCSKTITNLEEELSRERKSLKILQSEIQKENSIFKENKCRDTELISQLRIKLNEELDQKAEILEALETLKINYKNMEDYLYSIQEQANDKNLKVTDESSQKKLLLLIEKVESEKLKNNKLNEVINKLESERASYEKQTEVLGEELEKLQSQLIITENHNDKLKKDVYDLQEELNSKKEYEWNLTQHIAIDNTEVNHLRRELNNLRKDTLDMDADLKILKNQLTESSEREAQLIIRETELKQKLYDIENDYKKLEEIIEEQKNVLQNCLRRETEITDELKTLHIIPNNTNSPKKILQKIKELNKIVETLTFEKTFLQEQHAQNMDLNSRYIQHIKFLETQLSQKNKDQQPLSNMDGDWNERLQHFYGKFLRSDSRRKALLYQKQYLITVIAGFQRFEENTIIFLSQLTNSQKLYASKGKNRKNPKYKFKSAVLAIISVCRMKWLIVRWRSGRRIGANAVLGDNNIAYTTRNYSNTVSHSPPINLKKSFCKR